MDRNWMSKNRLTRDYISGVNDFINFAIENAKNPSRIPCPCTNCFNTATLSVNEVKNHLIMRGIDKTYVRWFWHGEKEQTTVDAEEMYASQGERLEEMVQAVEENVINRPSILEKLLSDAREPLYPSCPDQFTKLSAILKLYNLKASHGWTDRSFTALLELLKEMLPPPNVLPDCTYEAKKVNLCLYSLDLELQPELQNVGVAQQSEMAAEPSGPPTSTDKEILRNFHLYWPELDRKVAIGRAYVGGPGVVQLLHFKPLGTENMKVQVDIPLHPNEDLPFPTEETVVIKDAIGTPVAWPKRLVVFISDGVQESKAKKPSPPLSRIDKDKNSQKPHQKSTALDKYHLLWPTLSSGFVKEIDVSDHLGLHFPQPIYIQKEHIEDITVGKKPIDSIHISFYMKYLCKTRASDKYAFLCPTYLSADYKDGDPKQNVLLKQQYIANSMAKEEMKNLVWFLTYHEGFHWMLAVINPNNKMVYWLDPLGGDF